MRASLFIAIFTPRPAWFDEADCRGLDPALFHPARDDYGVMRQARLVCAGCPVRVQCLAHAVANDETYGIWGGTSPRERNGLRRHP